MPKLTETILLSESRATILVIEDEPHLVSGLRDALEHHGFAVLSAPDGEKGLELALTGRADLVLLDVMLPKIDGIQVCHELRQRGIRTPVIMLTAKSQEGDKVVGLDTGADDYITKPFSVKELLARVRAHLRRADTDNGIADRVEIGDAVVDFGQYVVFNGAEKHDLTDREVAMLRLMIEHPHEVITRDRLLDDVWGLNAYPTTRTIDTFMYRLRQKLEPDSQNPRHLLTVRGAGYKFIP
jgi:two-component system alkaline phosphatase synthesis response regulator PhoP